ncbi:DUF58 domain-containing protein [Pseudomonas typographi]|uniref:DUF58 domain-containing protein n=1 Tax=Pseudomonas typographi TaxID=2715964 RepID=UPI001686D46A|nr:DUF58 domain-containing protein [Pseudomonas typographi]MBD1550931.1 DUF58 domain-containing protein [Pseudomonas typographi]
MRPTRPALAWLAGLASVSMVYGVLRAWGVLGDGFAAPLWAALLALPLSAALDAGLLYRRRSPRASREMPANLPLGRYSEVWLELRLASEQPLMLWAIDHPPAGMVYEGPAQQVFLRPGQTVRLGYRLRPLRRGHFRFERCELHLRSALGLWTQRRYLALPAQARVFPDFARLHGAQLRLVDAWLGQLGVRQHPRRGEGQTFHQLRAFREGDALRQVDWKATSRLRTPIVREYQEERDQTILLWLDCSRRMRSRDGELAHFDHALNASLLLAYVALRQGDAVGLHTLATAPRRLSPGKGQRQLSSLLGALYDLDSSTAHADFSGAATQLIATQKRRALVILLTNLRDEDDEQLLPALNRVKRHHRVLVANLREAVVNDMSQCPVTDHAQALDYCAAVQYLQGRARLHERLAAQGVAVLDVTPSELGGALLGKYLEWKKAGVM